MDVSAISAIGSLCCHFLALLDLPSLATVSRTWLTTIKFHLNNIHTIRPAYFRDVLSKFPNIAKDSDACSDVTQVRGFDVLVKPLRRFKVRVVHTDGVNIFAFLNNWILPRTPKIRRLYLGSALPFGWILPKNMLSTLARCCRLLEHLDLRGASFRTKTIAQHAQQQQEQSYGAQVENMIKILKNFKSLKSLDVVSCLQVDMHVLPMLHTFLPAVRVQRLPNWFIRGSHICADHPGTDEAWFQVGEVHTYDADGKFRFEPRETCTHGVVNRCWPLDGNSTCDTGLVIELIFGQSSDDPNQPVLTGQVRIEKASALALAYAADARKPNSLFFTSAHSKFTTLAPPYTPLQDDGDVSVGVWEMDLSK